MSSERNQDFTVEFVVYVAVNSRDRAQNTVE